MTGYCEECGEQGPCDCFKARRLGRNKSKANKCGGDKTPKGTIIPQEGANPSRAIWTNIKDEWPPSNTYILIAYNGDRFMGAEIVNENRIEDNFDLSKADVYWTVLPW